MCFVKIILKAIGYTVLVAFAIILIINLWVYLSTVSDIYNDIEEVEPAQVALVLGTSHRLINGNPNPYFHERMQTAAELYHTGKVKHILVSGDNATRYYNEPEKMRRALVKLGVPSDDITLDYAGFRTLDSIVRCKKIFGQDHVIIITQPFHSYRALFISNYYEMNSVVMTTNEVEKSLRVQFREYLARMLAVWDLYIINREPKFLGKKETLDI
ncbi:ElyC/SanA/YdcF family protein [Fulvivirga kasyanovii]|uniref:SanA protein n=1 Tax=Fulvivirga kasyanovii TaxID=396812 RepID=A0ABW9RRP7_9BACT|nr:ElyC/SanA/YdcF family protein [Fulvivirga kasyanovii]MTI26545.1 SanA protein [Fulvivirga kasyanovii]